MELRVSVLSLRRRLPGLHVRLAASRDARPAPDYHYLDLAERSKQTSLLRWSRLKPSAETRLIWEACVTRRSPPEEGGDPEPVIVGGALSAATGRGKVVLRDFYAETDDVLAELDVELSGLPQPVAAAATGDEVAVIERLQERYEAYYARAVPHNLGDVNMRVPVFRFYGGEVQASYLALLEGGMDEAFAGSVLSIVLEDAGMTRAEFAAAGRAQLASREYLQETAAVVARVGELCTFTANIMRYRADLSVQGRLIEMIVPHVRDVLGGDCEDLGLEIYFFFRALTRMTRARDPELAIAARFASLYVCFLATTVATSPAAGGESRGGELLHVFALALTREDVRARLPARLAAAVSPSSHPWARRLPSLAPLEGTNWCDPLHLPLERYYGRLGKDVRGLREVERRETLAIELAPELRRVPTRIRQQLGAPLTETGFSGFYRRVTELWTADFADRGVCCFSVVSAGRYGVPLGAIASEGGYTLVPVFRHEPSELAEVKRALRCAMPVPEWRGEIRPRRLPRLEAARAGGRVRPARISRLHSDTVVYHFRSEALASSPGVLAALRKLEARFDVDYRAWRLPPQGDQKYVAVYAKEK
jgi:hypothetical protein